MLTTDTTPSLPKIGRLFLRKSGHPVAFDFRPSYLFPILRLLLLLPVLLELEEAPGVGGNDELAVRVEVDLERPGGDDQLVAAHGDGEAGVGLVLDGQLGLKNDQKWEILSEKKIVCFCSSFNSGDKPLPLTKTHDPSSNSIKKNI